MNTNAEGWNVVDTLTEREIEVVFLVGRCRLSYKAAAKRLEHVYRGGRVAPRTVREHACRIREKIGSPLPPRDALMDLYLTFPDRFDVAA